jgi:general secretion pathway protein G
MRSQSDSQQGFTLIELVVIIVIIGVIATIATMKMGESIETARFEQTKQELDNLAFAIVGNPMVYSDGSRADFGFVGDNGTLPTSLVDLVQNPGGWSTWDGPYIERGIDGDDFRRDAWGTNYTFVDTLIQSNGSGISIDKVFAPNSSVLLANVVTGYVVDADRHVPPGTYGDSITILFGYPDGSGAMAYASTHLDARGRFGYSSIPIGIHTLRVIYDPDSDTMTYPVTVYPGRNVSLDIVFPADLW